ncbi:hypothetical protein DAPPUDRAFT_53014, partial [Daphnia pulex]
RLQLHGFNTMSVDVKSYWRLLIDEVLNPFYLFEIFSCIVWTVDDYIYYAACIFVVSIISVGVALYEIRRQSETLKNMTAAHISSMVTVCRSGEVYENIYAIRLVPGDVIAIPPTGFMMPCDAVLVAGTCIVNESVLTGRLLNLLSYCESAPETKTPVPDLDESYCTDIHKRHTLFCGTQVLQTRYYGQDKVLAVVIRTGFTTAKGELVRSILYPKPIGFKFYVDSLKFVLLLFGVALCGITYCVYVYITKGVRKTDITRYDVMAPLVVKPVTRDTFLGVHGFDFAETGFEVSRIRINFSDLGIVRQFPFSSSLQRMSVVVRTLGSANMELLCKGSPEMIRTLCLSTSVPDNFAKVLRSYTMRGFRVLALAHRVLDRRLTWHQMHRMKREHMENNSSDNLLTAINVGRDCDMLPVGEKVILVTASSPKGTAPASITYSLAEMYETEIEESGVMSSSESDAIGLDSKHLTPRLHLALGGKTLDVIRKHFPQLLQRILVRATILARMTPDQKTKVVEEFQELGYAVGFCGDGANDCGALKAAHVGISLSDAEASVAAPFTARAGNISCVPTIIREGRCALVTSFGVFKYMALYSLIQFISVLILYSLRTTLGDYMFLYHDLFITTTVAVLMGHTEPYPHLVVHRPRGSLLTSSNMLSLVMQIALTAAIQLGALLLLMLQPWYTPVRPEGDEVIIPCWEVTVIFSISSFQYLILALAFSYGPPYRQPFYTNKLFLFAMMVLTAFSLVLTQRPTNDPRNSEPKNKYKKVELELSLEKDWPPLGQASTSEILSL